MCVYMKVHIIILLTKGTGFIERSMFTHNNNSMYKNILGTDSLLNLSSDSVISVLFYSQFYSSPRGKFAGTFHPLT